MNRRQKIIVSVTGIFIVLLILVGLTYAYFLTRIQGNTNDKSISVTTANLAVVYGDGNVVITGDKIQPGKVLDTKTFTVTNEGNEKTEYVVIVEDAVIKDLSNSTTTTFESNDFVYTLTCTNCDNDVEEYTTLPLKENILVGNEIEVGDTKYEATSGLMATSYEDTVGKYVYSIPEGWVKKVLSYNSIEQIINFQIEENVAEKTLSIAEDDYGTSYYYRGDVTNNYVSFAGFIWRIVRINGDGSIRLILNGITSEVKKEGESNYAGTSTGFSKLYSQNAYIGYMYGIPGSTTYAAEHDNINDSTIKDNVDLFYETYLKDSYSNYLADTIFCGDKGLASSGIGGISLQLGYGKNTTFYAASQRLYYSTGTTSITEATPTLKCATGDTNDYSRYTVEKYITPSGGQTNGDLTYPIALLSADELVMAGAFKGIQNTNYYLYDDISWWTMTPYNGPEYAFLSSASNSLGSVYLDGGTGTRPVINLKSSVSVNAGDGTEENPYTVKLS